MLTVIAVLTAGTQPNEGVVLTRNRDITRDAWRLPSPGSWYARVTFNLP